MTLLPDSLIYDLVLATIFVFLCAYLYFTSTFNYWKDKGVPFLKPIPVFGNVKDQLLGLKALCIIYQGFYDAFEGQRFGGFYEVRQPILMIRDPEVVEKILIKDFNHFYDRGFPVDSDYDPLSANLFHLEGNTWRNLRYKLTPTFTTGKLKNIFEQICNCGDKLISFIEKESKGKNAIEGKPLLSDFAFEVIASVAFGLQLDSQNEESKIFRKVIEVMFQPTKIQILRVLLLLYMPRIAKIFGIKQFPPHVERTVLSLVQSTLSYRRENSIKRNDFLQLMLNLQRQEQDGSLFFQKDIDYHAEDDVINQMEHIDQSKGPEDPTQDKHKVFMTDTVIAAQSFIFLTAGSESTSSTINFALYNLSQNPKIQKTAQREIDSVLAQHHNKWSYQAVKEMIYLEQIVEETLRMYPIVPFIVRVCTEPYKVPHSDLVIEKGIRVAIPVMAIQNDPQNYESPEVFDPDRFQGNSFKPSGIYLPFGNGPRVCIAMRFAVLEVKVVLARILANYSVRLSSKTHLPFKWSNKSFLLLPEDGFWFEFDKRFNE